MICTCNCADYMAVTKCTHVWDGKYVAFKYGGTRTCSICGEWEYNHDLECHGEK